jgi:hypothetical protein
MRNIAIVVAITWLVALDASLNNGAGFAAASGWVLDFIRDLVQSV